MAAAGYLLKSRQNRFQGRQNQRDSGSINLRRLAIRCADGPKTPVRKSRGLTVPRQIAAAFRPMCGSRPGGTTSAVERLTR